MQVRDTFPALNAGRSKGSKLGQLAAKAVNPSKVGKVMHEYKAGSLKSGSKKGPKVTSRKQAVAIAMSEAGMNQSGSQFGSKKRVKVIDAPKTLAGRRAEARRRAGIAHGD
jgi:hypothetical protein